MTQRVFRPSKEETFMQLAQVWAKRSTCSSRIAVGAVLVNQFNQVIASGYNGSPRGLPHCDEVGCELDSDRHCTRVIHAEENVVLQCATNGVSSRGCVLYVTHSPCVKCAARIIQAGIVAVIYDRAYKNLIEASAILRQAGIVMVKHATEEEWLND